MCVSLSPWIHRSGSQAVDLLPWIEGGTGNNTNSLGVNSPVLGDHLTSWGQSPKVLRAFNNPTEKKGGTTICYTATSCCTSTYFQEVDRRDTRPATLTRLWSRVPCCCYHRCFYTFSCCTSSAGFWPAKKPTINQKALSPPLSRTRT